MRKKWKRLAFWLIVILLSATIITIRITAAEHRWHQRSWSKDPKSSLDLPKQ